MSMTLVEMAASIITAQCSSTAMTADDIKAGLQNVYKTLQELQGAEASLAAGESAPATDLTPEKSIQKNKIVCLECGQEFKMLSAKHLASHGLDGRQYREKYGLKRRQPLCAKGLSANRQKSGKARGIPDNLKKSIEARKASGTIGRTPKGKKKAGA